MKKLARVFAVYAAVSPTLMEAARAQEMKRDHDEVEKQVISRFVEIEDHGWVFVNEKGERLQSNVIPREITVNHRIRLLSPELGDLKVRLGLEITIPAEGEALPLKFFDEHFEKSVSKIELPLRLSSKKNEGESVEKTAERLVRSLENSIRSGAAEGLREVVKKGTESESLMSKIGSGIGKVVTVIGKVYLVLVVGVLVLGFLYYAANVGRDAAIPAAFQFLRNLMFGGAVAGALVYLVGWVVIPWIAE